MPKFADKHACFASRGGGFHNLKMVMPSSIYYVLFGIFPYDGIIRSYCILYGLFGYSLKTGLSTVICILCGFWICPYDGFYHSLFKYFVVFALRCWTLP